MTLEWPATTRVARPETIVKRDGREVPFDEGRIEAALTKCFGAMKKEPQVTPERLARRVVNIVSARYAEHGQIPTVEGVQDIVEGVLQAAGEFEAAKHYILYRAEHERQRDERPIPEDVRLAYERDAEYFPTPLQRFQYTDKYARWRDDLGRRETWVETVDRLMMQYRRLVNHHAPMAIPEEVYQFLRRMVLDMKAMPSMRLLSMAGPAFERDMTTQYNCSYGPIDDPQMWVEGLLLSMAGCGVGFSVEERYTSQLPRIERQHEGVHRDIYVVEDSAEGWGAALRLGLERWFQGYDAAFDTSLIRPAGAPLRTKGGRASGSEPLERLLDFTRQRILSRQGKHLRPIDAHDIMCMVGGAAVSGGVRRNAMISIFDADDLDMLHAKDGDFERENSQRWNANNSAVWEDVADMEQRMFIRRFLSMVDSGRGEPGIFSRDAARAMAPHRRDKNYDFGVNPCGEIVLRPYGMCNLTGAVARSDDTLETLREKVIAATIMGTIQSLATYFPHLRPMWKANAEEERLLGVSLDGQRDCPLLSGPDGPKIMRELRKTAIETNAEFAALLGINRAASITCVKPSGNSSQLLDAASGLHPRWAPYYIRNARISSSSPLAKVLKDSGVPLSPENGDDPINPRTWVASFPVKAPEGATTRNDVSAIDQCEHWLLNKLHWTEHNPSITVTYRPDEVIGLMDWVWEHREAIGGMAFLPASDAQYAQLPYIEITEGEYERRAAAFPEIDFAKTYRYEATDMTIASQIPACDGPICELEPGT